MKRNIYVILLVFVLLLESIGVVFAESNIAQIDAPIFEDNVIHITASNVTRNKTYTLVVTRKNGNPSNFVDCFAVKEAESGSDGTVNFFFTMPETRSNLITAENPAGLTDGEYTISIRGKNETKLTPIDFTYVTETGKNQALSLLKDANSSQALDYLSPESIYRAAYVNSSFDMDRYDVLIPDVQQKVVDFLVANMPDNVKDIDEVFNISIDIVSINVNPDQSMQHLGNDKLVFENVKYEDAENELKSWIARVYATNVPYTSIDTFVNQYSVANILYKINKSSFNTIGNILSTYANALGISNNESYTRYRALNNDSQIATSENMIISMSKNPVYTINELIILMGNSITSERPNNKDYYDNGGNSMTHIGSGDITEIEPIESSTSSIFSDIETVSWAKNAIEYLYNNNIVSGVGDSRFFPDNFITREEFAKMVVLAMDIYNINSNSDFEDVIDGSWYQSYIGSAVDNNLLEGVGDNLFGVGDNISRQDVATIISRALEFKEIESTQSDDLFEDDDLISDYAKEGVYTLVNAGIINGIGDNKFDPKGSCTRAQAAQILYMFMTYIGDSVEEDIENPYLTKLRFLKGLGMFKSVPANEFDETSLIVKSKFITNGMRLIFDESYSDDDLIQQAKMRGIGSSQEYNFEGNMSVQESAEIIARVCGMDILKEKYPNEYTQYISYIKKGLSESDSEAITLGSVVNMLYNAALYEETILYDVNGSYEPINKTIIEIKRNIKKVTGIVTDNDLTSLTGQPTVQKGEVKIDGVIAKEGISGAGNYIGMDVYAYIYFDEDENNDVIFIEARKNNKELVISSDELYDVKTSIRKVEYEYKNRTKTATYSPVVKIIKNGKFLPNYTVNDLKITNGTLRMIDNNNDGAYDIIFVESYTYLVVDGVLSNQNKILNVYKEPDTFEFTNVTDYKILYDGEEIAITDIKQKDVLNVLHTGTTDDDRVIIYVSRDKVRGTVTGFDASENTIKIDDKEYKLSDAYLKAKSYTDSLGNGDAAAVEPKMSVMYDFYLDCSGRIAYIEASGRGNDFYYVYATRFIPDDFEESYSLKYFTMNSTWETAQFAKKVKYNSGNSMKVYDFARQIQTEGFAPDVYRIKYNSDGEIVSFDKAQVTTDADTFNKKTVTGKWSTNSFGLVNEDVGGGIELFLDGSSKVVLIPNDGNQEDYSISDRTFFRVDSIYTLTGYGVDDFGTAQFTVYESNAEIKDTSPIVIADKVQQELIDDEVLPRLYGAVAGQSDFSVVGATENVFNGISRGDLIAVSLNNTGRVNNKKVLISASMHGTKMTAKTMNADGNFTDSKLNNGAVYAAGYVEKIDYDGKKMLVDTGTVGGQAIRLEDAATVFIYDENERKVSSGTLNDIVKGDYMFMRFGWSKINLIYIIRK